MTSVFGGRPQASCFCLRETEEAQRCLRVFGSVMPANQWL